MFTKQCAVLYTKLHCVILDQVVSNDLPDWKTYQIMLKKLKEVKGGVVMAEDSRYNMWHSANVLLYLSQN